MKRALLLVSIIFIIQSTIFPQEVKTIVQEAFLQVTIQEESYPIPGSHLLREKEQKILEYFKQHPDANRLVKSRSTAWNFDVDSTYTWWADSLIDGAGQYQVPSTCRGKGTNCYIFVEDAVWGTNQVDQDAIDAIVDAFDNSTPQGSIDPSKGIFDIDVQTFGTPPDVDNDPRIILLILDIRDGWSGSGGYVAGYFYSANEYPDGDPAIGSTRSNFAEIFYMDCNPTDLITDRTDVLNITAHEFQHMIHWAHDTNESTFVNEGLSEIASYICGYGLRSSGRYAQNTNVNLLSWGTTEEIIDDYSRAALWTLYMYEQFPIDIMKDFVNRSHPGWVSFNTTIGTYAPSRNFFSVFEDWLLANHVNDATVDNKYSYTYAPIVKPSYAYSHVGVLNASATTDTLNALSAHYIEFSGGSNLAVTFVDVSGTIRIRAIKSGNSTVVEEVPNNTVYMPTGYGTTYNKVVFLIYNASPDQLAYYTYSAAGTSVTGSMELAYDDGIPERPLNLTENDTMTVQFNGIAGAKIDSIKAGFKNAGGIIYGVHKFTGGYRTATGPFGQVLVPSQNLNVPTSSSSLDPFDNWINIDLSNQNIDGSEDFIIYFVVGNDNQVPGLMASAEPDDGLRQLTFLQDQNPPDWFYLTDVNNNIWKYLVRAYVSIGGTTVAIDQSGIVTIPNEFSLEQNYPNPFNPSTTFRFSTPKDGLVKFTVHDLLGRVVYSENRNLFAGNYSFTWEGNNMLNQQVVSGVYFLRMEAEGFSQTRKMLMIK